MRKIIFTLILILIAVGISLSIISRGDEYAAEKLFYRAMKISKKIAINPDVAPPAMLAAVENDLKAILEKYGHTRAAKAAHIVLAELYVMDKEYAKAHITLDEIIETEDQDMAMLAKAHFFKGSIYEKQDQWDKALGEYAILQDRYANTTVGLQIPLYIGRYYAGKGRDAEADQAYRDAAAFYDKLANDNKSSMLGYASLNMLRESYVSLKDYEQAGKVIEDTINNYPSLQVVTQQLPYVEIIYVYALKRPEKAIEIYKNVQGKIKNTQIIEALQKKIDEWETQD